MPSPAVITSPRDSNLDELCAQLAAMSDHLDHAPQWPAEQLRLCGRYGVFQWFVPREWGGQQWDEADVTRGYLRLSAACLTTTFIITQRTGACVRILASDNRELQERLLPDLVAGESFATVGISHLTTSRRHLARPVLRARQTSAGFLLDGYSPWVTGGAHAETIVTGATLDDGRQLLAALPTSLAGVIAEKPVPLVGLTASHTGMVKFDNVTVPSQWILAGPVEDVMSASSGAGTGGLQTSTLAVGLAQSAVAYLLDESTHREELCDAAANITKELNELRDELLAAAGGHGQCSKEEIRQRANSLVLRATQAALTAAKGAGYVIGHPAGRWCREALFFLVWSCPQPVTAAYLCELAGLRK